MSNMTAEQVESGTGGILVSGSRTTLFTGVSIDTRTLQPGDLFFAIRGRNNDGHAFVPLAIEKGAAGAVIDSDYAIPEGLPKESVLLRVRDTHQALKDLAADARRQWRGSLVAITGSMGKTTTKEFAAQVLQTEYAVYRSPGNFNNLFGLPLSILGLRPDDHIGILEMGMSAPGEIAEMCRIAEPDIGIITNVAPVHLEFFSSLQEIAAAKGELAEGLGRGGVLIYNEDDPLVRGIADRFVGNKISFGMSHHARVRADEIEIAGLEETRFRLQIEGIQMRAVIPLAGAHFVMNLLPAVALAYHYRLAPEQILESLRHLQQAEMRGQILESRKGFAIIDDSYNSNPNALKAMVQTLAEVPGFRRKILVAGEMLELGKESGKLHFACGEWAARCGIDVLVAVRGNAREIAAGALATGISADQVHFFENVPAATDFILNLVRSGDLILIKASRGVRADKIVKALCNYAEGSVH